MSALLYIVATPIGNLEDMTFRAVRMLKEVALIAAEDTRHSRKLLAHYGITTPLTSYFDHNQTLKGERILATLRDGKSVALISDAGTPCISDPGYHLVRDALAEGIRVVPLPGACAAVTALSAAGLPTDSFHFAGFPPAREGKRRSFLAALAGVRATLVLYEAPHRLAATLADIAAVLGNRQLAVARELTKLYEEFLHGTAHTLLEQVRDGRERGEVVILIAPGDGMSAAPEGPAPEERLRTLLAQGHSVKEAAALVAAATGLPRRELYAQALLLR
ncbi:16S rRNA (cytidine(1402)-2'-O)-methyltransferase [Trichlorobacter ammonificans]|uniref:Ribosomal RNA small subunit methyltransferase I n=1 Tax=Trichlorobacter ammonificans TaxID=2916410 RepID=A0ABN8HJE1_9BACT|nr:16S rRNA (cytidine(1402)-2'-O)-methyltransferase [Trichlorobacter ammonificans]CAH2031450.1 Ribosomal RNA small subunit methyltransferase I [Trichlorobacter ammonificans]